MGKTLKRFLGIRISVSKELIFPLIGDLETYIQIRETKATAKIKERFFKENRATTKEIPSLFPNLNLIPLNYIKILNLINCGICKLCNVRYTWNHLEIMDMQFPNQKRKSHSKSKDGKEQID